MSDQELEIDLRPYIQLLFRHWFLILSVMVLASICAFLVTAALPPYYESTAFIAITKPNYIMAFDSRIQTLDDGQPVYKAFPEIAQSSAMAVAVFDALDPVPDGIDTPLSLAQQMEAVSGADPSLLHLTVTMPNPQEAARIANMWAAVFIQQAHSIYGNQSEDEVRFFETQLAQNRTELENAEQELIDFEASNDLAILQNQLNLLTATHLLVLNQQRDKEFVIRDLAGLQQNLQSQNPDTPASFADQLSLLSLQTAAYAAGSRLPVDLQLVDTTTLSGQTVRDQLRVLNDLITTLQDQNVANSTKLETLGPQITALQQQIRIVETEQTRLVSNLAVKRDMDTALSRKVEEVTMASQESPSEFRVAASAIAPEEPSGPSKMINTAVAGIVAAVLCVSILLLREFLQNGLTPLGQQGRQSESRVMFGDNGDRKKEKQGVREEVIARES